jgi:hypothetical protein
MVDRRRVASWTLVQQPCYPQLEDLPAVMTRSRAGIAALGQSSSEISTERHESLTVQQFRRDQAKPRGEIRPSGHPRRER